MAGFFWAFEIGEGDTQAELAAGRLCKIGQWKNVVMYVWDVPTDRLVSIDAPLMFETLGDRLSLASWQSDVSAEGRVETPEQRATRQERAIAGVGLEWARLEAEFRDYIEENPIGTCFGEGIVVARLSPGMSHVEAWKHALAKETTKGSFSQEERNTVVRFAPLIYVPRALAHMYTFKYDDKIKTVSLAPSVVEMATAIVQRSKGERLKPYYAFVTEDDDERIVRMIFDRLMAKITAWCTALAGDEQAAETIAIHQGSRKRFLRLLDRGRFFIFEAMPEATTRFGDNGALGYTNILSGYALHAVDSDYPLGIALTVRMDWHDKCSNFTTPGALFCIFLHEMAHVLDSAPADRPGDHHDESFQQAYRYNLLLAHRTGLLTMLLPQNPSDFRPLEEHIVTAAAAYKSSNWIRESALEKLKIDERHGEKRTRQEDADAGEPAAKVQRFKALVHLA